jgi:hypothetical protein
MKVLGRICLFSLVAALLLTIQFPLAAASASEAQVKIQTRMPYSEDNGHGIRRKLTHEFKKDAFKKFMTSLPQAKSGLIQQYFDEITTYEKIDQFITKVQFAGKCDDTQCGKLNDNTLVLSGMAWISRNAVDNFLKSKSAVGNAVDTSDFAVMFIARKVSSRKVFDNKTAKVSSSSSSASTEVVSGSDGTSDVSGGSQEDVSVNKSGGSVEKKGDSFVYEIDLGLTEALQTAIQEQLINAGFEPFPMDDVLYDYDEDGLEEMIENGKFGDNGSLSRKTLSSVKKTAALDEVTFLGVGRVDYRLGEKNTQTGKMQVPAIVTVEVFQKKGRRMRTIASVQPTTVFGDYPNGGDYTVGQIDAQNNAVRKAMDTIISQLQAAGVY